MILWEAVFGCVGRSNVTFFLSLSSVDEAVPPWMWGKTVGGRSQQPRNPSPPPIASLPLSHKHGNPPHSVSRTLPQPRWEKTWPHRAPSSRRETKEGVRRAQKRMFCLCGYQEAGCCLYPPSREKRGGLKTAAPAPQPANPARRWRQWPPPSPFPTSKLGSGTQAPSPNSAANSVSLTLTPRPPNPYVQELGGEGAATPYLRAKPIRGTATRPSPRQVSKARKERQKQSGRAEEDLPRSHGSQPRPRPAVLTALFTSSSS